MGYHREREFGLREGEGEGEGTGNGAGAGESGIARDRVAVAASGGWVVFNATVAEAERLLQTEFWLYEQKDTGVLAAGCDE